MYDMTLKKCRTPINVICIYLDSILYLSYSQTILNQIYNEVGTRNDGGNDNEFALNEKVF